MDERLPAIYPVPRRYEPGDGVFVLPHECVIEWVTDDIDLILPAMREVGAVPHLLRETGAVPHRLRERVVASSCEKKGGDAAIRFAVGAMPHRPRERGAWPQHLRDSRGAYSLRVTPAGIEVEAGDREGAFYAAQTLRCLLTSALCGGGGGTLPSFVPALTIEDAPDFPVRGVMLDISRDKVPTMQTLFRLVDLFAALRYNQLQLYMEHAFAYRGHEAVWQNASPMTPDEIRTLDAYCRDRCIELVPNQNSFGHLERWLAHEEYRDMAELPQGGAPLPWGGTRDYPSALCPTDPRTLPFLAGLYDQLLPCFSSPLFNVGCDEVFDLCPQSRSVCGAKDAPARQGRVYLDFLKDVHRLVSDRGHTMLFWDDMFLHHPELARELPRDIVALEWGYEEDHPFDAHCRTLRDAGIPFYVCPGTSSWRSLFGRTTNMTANIRIASHAGIEHGATGFLLTDWGDAGHWQPLVVSIPAFVYGGLISWCAATNAEVDLSAATGAFALNAAAADALLRLGDLYLKSGAKLCNCTAFFQLLNSTHDAPFPTGVTAETLREAEREMRRIPLMEAAAGLSTEDRADFALLDAFGEAVWRKGDGTVRTDEDWLRQKESVARVLEQSWLLRNRPGGLADSLAKLKGETK
ncbi:MAG: family 20 glycosylhydrolase [Kiritimatiellae bacterium]|nr:family 20 glycosylhydrolase [Kiritimatiellia bacterium]